MENIIKKADIVLLCLLLVLGLVLSIPAITQGSGGSSVVVRVDGEIYGTYSLTENRTITVNANGHLNKININDGKVQMSEADCHNQLCVKQGSISAGNQVIVCLPNRVIVEIIGGEEEYDVISG